MHLAHNNIKVYSIFKNCIRRNFSLQEYLRMSQERNNSYVKTAHNIVQFLLISFVLQCVFMQETASQKQVQQTVINQNKRMVAHQKNEELLHRNEDGISRCATYQMEIKNFGRDAEKMSHSRETFIFNAQSTREINNNILKIPVVFHIIHDGDAIGNGQNIDAVYIEEQINQANNDFRKIPGTSGDGQGIDTRIEFIPATVDPMGNIMSEPGINRVNIDDIAGSGPYSIATIEGIIKPSTIWNPVLYFNTWTIDIGGGILGYAQYPESPELVGIGMGPLTDGVAVRYTTVGSTEDRFPGGAPYNAGRTWTHEAGHFLGLVHIWGDGDCMVDDFCSDTPNAAQPSSGCPQRDTCPLDPGDDQSENYMDYSDDICMNTFTECQSDRMRTFLGSHGLGSVRRTSLVNSPVATTDGFVLIMNKTQTMACYEDAALYDFTMTFVGSFSDEVIPSVLDLPEGIQATFSGAMTSSGSYSLLIDQLDILIPDQYEFSILVSDTNGNSQVQKITLDVDFPIDSPPTLIKPIDSSNPLDLPAVFEWTPVTYGAKYLIEIAADSEFNSIIESATVYDDIHYPASLLAANTTYFWRVRGLNSCMTGPWSEIYSLTTGTVTPCFDYAIGPFIDFNDARCFPKCEQAITLTEEVWANEAYKINGLSEGAEYIFEFCDGYDPEVWSAYITVTDTVGNFIAAGIGCSLNFQASASSSIIVIISDECGGEFQQIDNGFPSFSCTGMGSTIPEICKSCFVDEDFEMGMPPDWTSNVSGSGNRLNWIIDNHPFAFFIFSGYLSNNPGSGNWLYYDDDANGPSANPNVATVKTKTYNLVGVDDVTLSFDYDYIDQGFASLIFLSITDDNEELYFDGSRWLASRVPWLDSDARGTFSELIPTSLNPEQISVSISYDDGGQWAWGFGMDNFALCGNCADFDELETICQNSIPPVLPNTSLNGVSGTWEPEVINTATSGVTTYWFIPNIQSSCGRFALNVKIEATDDASFVYSDSVFCKGMADPKPIITGLSGGQFLSTGPIAIDPLSGKIDLSLTQEGSYEINYQTNGLCQSNTSKLIEILPVFECPVIIPETIIASQNFLSFGDPCQCDNINNCVSRLTGETFVHDTIRIPSVGSMTPGLDIRIAEAFDFYIHVDCQNEIYKLPKFGLVEGTQIPEVSPGVYKLGFWKTTTESTSLTIVSGNSVLIEAPENVFSETCNCFIPIPTLGEWALICLALLLLIVSVVTIQAPNESKPLTNV